MPEDTLTTLLQALQRQRVDAPMDPAIYQTLQHGLKRAVACEQTYPTSWTLIPSNHTAFLRLIPGARDARFCVELGIVYQDYEQVLAFSGLKKKQAVRLAKLLQKAYCGVYEEEGSTLIMDQIHTSPDEEEDLPWEEDLEPSLADQITLVKDALKAVANPRLLELFGSCGDTFEPALLLYLESLQREQREEETPTPPPEQAHHFDLALAAQKHLYHPLVTELFGESTEIVRDALQHHIERLRQVVFRPL